MNNSLSTKLEDYFTQAAKNAIILTPPEVVAEFCTEQYGHIRPGRKDARYLRQNLIERQVCMDLNEGYEPREVEGSASELMMNAIGRSFKDKAIEQTMKWIIKTTESQDKSVKESNAGIRRPSYQ
uniref:Uncharacterized protein n=1 Tax=Ditylenchus dipsaci TaxID=166011 RepID=A0A915DHE4_9BILA